MTFLPLTLAMTALSLTATLASATPNADIDNNGIVDSLDLLLISTNLNQTCDGTCVTDLNDDGMTDIADLLIVMQQWGPVEGYVAETIESDDSSTTSNDNDTTRDMSWQGQGPVLLDAIYYDHLARSQPRQDLAAELDQGALTKAWTAANSIAVQPMAYNGGVDWYADNEYSDDDRLRFKNWVDENFPADYDGPLCLDMEGTWWATFDTGSQHIMDIAIDFYIEGLEYAQSLRPNAKIGYWGLPKKSHTKVNSTTASVERLLRASTGLFPDVYDHNPTGNGSNRLRLHVEKAIEMVEGQIPVYVQASPRYKLQGGQYDLLHTVEEFMHDQVDPALAAVWTDANGTEHRIAAISIWDAYVYFSWYTENWSTLDNETRKAMWDGLDAYHVELLGHMKNSVDAAYAAAQARIKAANSTVESTGEVVVLTVLTQKKNATNAYNSSASSYRSARQTWSSAQRTFAAASRKYSKGSSQYNRALDSYQNAQEQMRDASQSYREQRQELQTSRANWNSVKAQWNATSSTQG